MIGAIDPHIGNRARRAVADGYRILKIKLGVLPPEQERAALTALADGLPSGILLRLDANRAWQEDTARAMIDALAQLPIEGLEEPLRRTDFKALRRLQAIAPWPIALDESVVGAALGELLASPPVRRIVLKPMVIGGPLSATRLAARVRAAGLEPVVTTTVDAAVGTCAALHTAAALMGDATHGLATSAWLAEDVAPPPGIEGGYMVVGDRPGLGVTPYDSIRFEETVDV
jgi:L-alanine-DL-glutamate epimerase-like enolase superfamily enzyme